MEILVIVGALVVNVFLRGKYCVIDAVRAGAYSLRALPDR
jgi:hypothetical protein